MASIKFRRSLLLLVALIKCSMPSATDINIDVCRNNMLKFGDAAIVTIPSNNYQLKVVVDTTLDFQCQSICGSLKWLYNNTEYSNNPFVESVNKRQYLANDSCTTNCLSLIQCNDEDSILKGPIVYNLTVTFHKVGMYVFQCKSELQGEENSLWNFKQVFEVYSEAIMIEVVKEEPAISSPSPSPTFSQSSIPSPSKSSSLSPSQSVLLSPSLSPSQSLLLFSSQSTLLSLSQSFTLSNKLLSSSIGTSSHFTDSSKSTSSTFVYSSTSSLATDNITSLNTLTVTSTLLITTVLTHSFAITSSTTTDNVMPTIKPFESLKVKATVSILVVLLTVMILFAVFGWGFCLMQWHIKKHYQSIIKLNEHPGRTHNDNSLISAETDDSGFIANTCVTDYSIPENKQEMTSSL